jgi:hypothetical protein
MTAITQASAEPSVLERRYGRLLTCYPPGYRREYASEMLGVLMTASTPGQRRPDVRETINLIGSGLRLRFDTALRGTRRPAWGDAAGVFGIIASVFVAVMFANPIIDELGFWSVGGPPPELLPTEIAMTVCWAIVARLAISGRRRVGGLIGGVATIVYLAYVQLTVGGDLESQTFAWSRVGIQFAALLTAAALIASAQRADRLLPRTDLVPIVGAGVAVLVEPVAGMFIDRIARYRDGNLGEEAFLRFQVPFGLGWMERGGVAFLILILAVIAVIRVLWRLDRPLRRRVLLLGAACFAVVTLMQSGHGSFPLFMVSRAPHTGLLGFAWLGFLVVPMIAVGIGAWLVRAYERLEA